MKRNDTEDTDDVCVEEEEDDINLQIGKPYSNSFNTITLLKIINKNSDFTITPTHTVSY